MGKKMTGYMVAVIMGTCSMALAANPFSDLPQGHWAYGAVAKLAAEGVVDGYPDGTFQGNQTLTRYEMAQIVARALAKGAVGADNKLVSEFADELENLGVRVTRLEKNADNVRVTGNVRYSYRSGQGSALGEHTSQARLQTRLYVTGEINDNWSYTSRLENNQFFEGRNESGDSTTLFNQANLDGKIGIVSVSAGRLAAFYGDGTIYDGGADAIEVRIPVGQAYVAGGYGKFDDSMYGDKYWRTEVGGQWGHFNMAANYMKMDNVVGDLGLNGKDNRLWSVEAKYKIGDVQVGATYLKGDDDTLKGLTTRKGKDVSGADDDGWTTFISYKGAEAAKPGSWGLVGTYYNLGAPTVLCHTIGGHSNYEYFGQDHEGFKGYSVGGYLTVAKNMVAGVEYYDLKGKETSLKDRTLRSQLVVTF